MHARNNSSFLFNNNTWCDYIVVYYCYKCNNTCESVTKIKTSIFMLRSTCLTSYVFATNIIVTLGLYVSFVL